MAVMQRLALINEGKYRAGVDSTQVTLTTEYDQVLRYITGNNDLLRGNVHSAVLTKSDTVNYLDLKGLAALQDFKHPDHMKCDTTTRVTVEMFDGPIFWSSAPTFSNGGIPTKGTYEPSSGRIYLSPFPNAATVTAATYYIWFTKYHPKSTGDTYLHILGEEFDEVIVYGLAADACEITKQFQKANYFRLVFDEGVKICSEIARKRMIRYEFPER